MKPISSLPQLKQLYRQGWLKRGVPPERCESVAEHTLGVAVLVMLLADTRFPELDAQKVLRMALLHDFGEIDAGDFTPIDGISLQEKHRLEKESVFERPVQPVQWCGLHRGVGGI